MNEEDEEPEEEPEEGLEEDKLIEVIKKILKTHNDFRNKDIVVNN
jgi:hypothetical protein